MQEAFRAVWRTQRGSGICNCWRRGCVRQEFLAIAERSDLGFDCTPLEAWKLVLVWPARVLASLAVGLKLSPSRADDGLGAEESGLTRRGSIWGVQPHFHVLH
jgi:hypothetical protein